MSIKLADTLEPMANFPAVMAANVQLNNGKTLQEVIDAGGSSYVSSDNKVTLIAKYFYNSNGSFTAASVDWSFDTLFEYLKAEDVSNSKVIKLYLFSGAYENDASEISILDIEYFNDTQIVFRGKLNLVEIDKEFEVQYIFSNYTNVPIINRLDGIQVLNDNLEPSSRKVFTDSNIKIEEFNLRPSQIPLMVTDIHTIGDTVTKILNSNGQSTTTPEYCIHTWTFDYVTGGTTTTYELSLYYVYIDSIKSRLEFRTKNLRNGEDCGTQPVVGFAPSTPLTFRPEFPSSFTLSKLNIAGGKLPTSFFDDCLNMFKVFSLPYMEGYKQINNMSLANKSTVENVIEVVNDNNIAKLMLGGDQYLRLLLGPGKSIYLALAENKLIAYPGSVGTYNGDPTSIMVKSANLLAEPNVKEVYKGDFNTDFGSGVSINGSSAAFNIYRVTTDATNQPGGSTQGVMIVKYIEDTFPASVLGSGLAVYFSDTGIHYQLGKGGSYPQARWTGNWKSFKTT